MKSFFDEMPRLGWIEGRTIACDRVYEDDQMARLMTQGVDAIFGLPAVATLARQLRLPS